MMRSRKSLTNEQICLIVYELDDIALADYKIISTEINFEQRSILITSVESYYVPEERWLGKTTVAITDWNNFICTIYVFDSVTEKSSPKIANGQEEVETFRWVQEVVKNDNDLKLGGWSKESGFWMEYIFTVAKVHVEAEESSDDNE